MSPSIMSAGLAAWLGLSLLDAVTAQGLPVVKRSTAQAASVFAKPDLVGFVRIRAKSDVEDLDMDRVSGPFNMRSRAHEKPIGLLVS
jgi:hypothetical protein